MNNLKAFGKDLDRSKVEQLAAENLLKGDLSKFNAGICFVCGNHLNKAAYLREGLHQSCMREVVP